MFADAHRLATQSFEQRLETQLTAVRLEISRDLSDLRFDLLKWSFVFWVGQLAAMTGIVALLLRGLA